MEINLHHEDPCTVPGCISGAEFDSPGIWCSYHWQMWWDWPEDKDSEAPFWFPKDEDS
jgi:hypothetical protein